MKLSIITINFNDSVGLKQTIESVINQTWQDFEFIIIDGGSTDESCQIIRKYEANINYWISEKDHGVYNAMNKGIKVANGDYLLMLNAGDYLANKDVLATVFSEENRKADIDIYYTDVYRAADGKIFDESIFLDKLTFDFLRKGTLSHQAMFIKRSLHEIVGLYDEDLKFSSDWKFTILAICKYNVSYKHLHNKTTVCDCGGLTCNPANFEAMGKESESVLVKEFSAFIEDYKILDYLRESHSTFPNIRKFIKKGMNKLKKSING